MATGKKRHGGSQRRRTRRRRVVLTAFCWALALMMLALGAYVAWWYIDLGRIQRAGERYAGLYGGEGTAAPTAVAAPEPSPDAPAASDQPEPAPVVTAEPAPEVTAEPSPVVTAEPTTEVTAEPSPVVTAEPTTEVTAEPTPIVTAEPTTEVTAEPSPVVTAEPTTEVTAEPTPVATPEPSPAPTEAPEGQPLIEALSVPMAVPSPEPTEAPLPVLTPEQASQPLPVVTPESSEAPLPVITFIPTPEPALIPLPTPVSTHTPASFGADMPMVEDMLIPTPGADTLVYAIPTPPPPQASFDALLALNPETVGFLEIEDMLALPVAQRENDNDYYLSHTFEGDQAQEGALFLDGMNRLVPEDDCLIVYGHNMKNKTMFGRLNSYGDVSFLRRHAVIRFDTLYENRRYVAFAAFTASMKPGDARYFDVRQFIFDEAEFDKFVLKLQSRSLCKSPIDVRYGDRLLLLVTCDHSRAQSRFILALRQLRPDEVEDDVRAQAMGTATK